MDVTDLIVRTAGWLILAGILVFFTGAAFGVPQVFVTRTPEARLALLRSRAGAWRTAQWFYAGGPVLTGVGVLVLAAAWSGPAQLLAGSAGGALLAGAVLFSVSCARRGHRIEEFARGQLPAGPWLGYVWLTLVGLALLGLASLEYETWIGVLLLVAAAAFTALFVISRDIPPFAFYLVLAVYAGWVLVATPH